ncbi:KilA-N domain-containing protein [Salmonella enterica]|uniref:KilA-N domain-containing protein n=1 Tax=Salmonella enterica TaxID=28901 RepID=UPI0034A05BFE
MPAREAAGENSNDRLSLWKDLDSTKEFLIPGNPGIKSKAGRYGGTWGIEQVVYAYASWISPE